MMIRGMMLRTRIPTSNPRTTVPIPVNHHIPQEAHKRNKPKKHPVSFTVVPTFDIPFGSNKTSAKRTSPAITGGRGKISAIEPIKTME